MAEKKLKTKPSEENNNLYKHPEVISRWMTVRHRPETGAFLENNKLIHKDMEN
jgi:hypothetical protein